MRNDILSNKIPSFVNSLKNIDIWHSSFLGLILKHTRIFVIYICYTRFVKNFVKWEKIWEIYIVIEIVDKKTNNFVIINKNTDILTIVGRYICCKLLSCRYCKYFSSFLMARCSRDSFIWSGWIYESVEVLCHTFDKKCHYRMNNTEFILRKKSKYDEGK